MKTLRGIFHPVLPFLLMPGCAYRCSVGGASSSAHHAHGSDLRWSVRCPDRGISHPGPRRTGAVMRWRGAFGGVYCVILYTCSD